ncbi:MAG: GPW/gp25 family protein [Chloroflexi bacterium]|jgi:phage baseplate assembly protein W|nr:GPW/gp25 family protein [Chloroflexota bacterium]MBK6710795.1 GPW/gp25 family protein [Chloroflexota bacterium]MBK7176479.1 GPW/gp25 family protein [Chloroflexota bacterium]MBK8933925.1 GPW/gp25 family protein [Chloroflexota bacterium]MBP6803838.1 GPW/gp25 family protein [Chloroflexota bacterium]
MTTNIIGQGWAFPPKIGPQGGFALTHDQNELDQAIRIILMTAPGQRVMRPTFGCRLHDLLFAPNNNHTAVLARRYVEEALGMWEPRIRVHTVAAYADPDEAARLLIEITYEIKATNDRRSLVYPFYLIPEE